MRIVHVANFYGARSGGLRTTMDALTRGYARHGHEPVLVVPGEDLSVTTTGDGVQYVTLPSRRLPLTGGYRVITRRGLLRQVLTALEPDVLEVSDRTTLIGLGDWARPRGIATVAFAHERLDRLIRQFSLGAPLPVTGWADAWNRRLAGTFDTVVATTGFAAEELGRIGADNVVRVPLGVDLDVFHPRERDLRLRARLAEGADLLLVHCSRLSVEKHPRDSLQTLRHLLALGIDARLVVLGSGPLEPGMRRAARDLPVTFPGFVPRQDGLAGYLASADVAIAPGPHETFGLAAMEAMACGTPVVVNHRSALPELIGTGGLAGDGPGAYARAVVQMLPELARWRREARLTAAGYPWQATVRRMLEVHRKVAPQPGSPLGV